MPALIDFPSDPPAVWRRLGDYKGKLAFDVGANAGMVSAILAHHFDRVVSYEPCVESYEKLASRVILNMTPINQACSDREGHVVLQEAQTAMGIGELVTGTVPMASWGPIIGDRTVASTTLNREAETWGVPDFVKIDTEGHEAKVIDGGLEMLEEHHPQLFIEVHNAENGDHIVEMLPFYDLTEIVHPYYEVGSWEFSNHFWLVG